MSAPRLLDAFSGAGGAGMGYHMAGFDVTGVDIAPQPRYPFAFIQGDALDYIARHGHEYDAIHASPPCQAYSATKTIWNREHPDLVAPTRNELERIGKPWVIENVVGAPLRTVIELCGSMFGLKVYRHRRFESSHLIFQPPHSPHRDQTPRVGRGISPKGFISVSGHMGNIEYVAKAMGIDWMVGKELSQAIPPAYTKHIGDQLMRAIEPEPTAVVPPGGSRADLGRAVSPVYRVYRCGKTLTPAQLLAEVRRVHPGARINCHADFVKAVGPADDLAVLFGVQPNELFVIAEGRR